MAEVKICGLKDADNLDVALREGARFVGFVFFANSPRNVAIEAAARLAERARGKADVVAVTVDADDALLERITAEVRPDWVQAHGRETPARVASLARFAAKGVIKAVSISGAEDFAQVPAFEGAAQMLMFDAKVPVSIGRPGGAGAAFDWSLLEGRRFSRPWFLSGGLNPENAGQAIRLSGAALLDVSSGVESAPGLKDPARIAAFLKAARAV